MPAKPPMAEKITPENDKIPAPHKPGMNPPIVEPINKPIQIKGLDFIIKV